MRPDPTTAKRWVLLSILGLLVMAAYRDATGKSSGGGEGFFRRLWGVGVLGTMLTVAADFAPTVAGPFAILVLLGYATAGGDKAIQNVLGKVSGGGGVQVHVVNTPAGVQVPQPTSPGPNP